MPKRESDRILRVPSILQVTADRGPAFSHIRGAIKVPNGTEGCYGSGQDPYWDPPIELNGFQVNSQGDSETAYLYGQQIGFNGSYSLIGLNEAERYLRVLRFVDRRLAASTARFGPPATVGAYFVRVGDALGVKKYAVQRAPVDRHTDLRFDEVEPAKAVHRIDEGMTPYCTSEKDEAGVHRWRAIDFFGTKPS